MRVGRPKEFDEREALEAAMGVFWRKGFEGASCEALMSAMKINAGSMYATFGDKETLYKKVFNLYREKAFGKMMQVLNGPGSPLQNVRKLVHCWADVMSNPDCKGCLITNTIIEFGQETEGIVERARELVQQMQACFEEKLKAAKVLGELGDEVDEKALAAFLINTAQGLTVMARSGVEKKTIQGVVDTALTLLQ